MYFNLEVHPIFYLNFNQTVDRWSLWTSYRPSRTRTRHHWNDTPPFSCPTIPDTVRNVHPRDTGVTLSRSSPKPLCSPNQHVEFTWVHMQHQYITILFVYYLHCRSTDAVWAWCGLCFKHSWLACYYFMFFTY